MDEKERRLHVRRILLALDPSTLEASMLVEAVQLAARFQAELLGFFVEDADLFRLTGRSSVKAVDTLVAAYHDLDSREIECLLGAQARRIRRYLTMLAERLGVSASFLIRRGRIIPEVLAEAGKADVLVLGKHGWALVKSRRLSPATRAMLSASPVSTLIIHPGSRLERLVWVVYDGSPLADRALATAVSLAECYESPLTVLVLGDGMESAVDLQLCVERQLKEHALQVHYHLLTESTVPKIISVVQMAGGGTMVLPAEGSVLHEGALEKLLEEVGISVLLVRKRQATE